MSFANVGAAVAALAAKALAVAPEAEKAVIEALHGDVRAAVATAEQAVTPVAGELLTTVESVAETTLEDYLAGQAAPFLGADNAQKLAKLFVKGGEAELAKLLPGLAPAEGQSAAG